MPRPIEPVRVMSITHKVNEPQVEWHFLCPVQTIPKTGSKTVLTALAALIPEVANRRTVVWTTDDGLPSSSPYLTREFVSPPNSNLRAEPVP